jgi:hypothetical protein
MIEISFIILLLFGGIITDLNASEVRLNADDIAHSVVFLHVPSEKSVVSGSQTLEMGTGFLVNLNGRLFLATAAHVAKLIGRKASMTLAVENDSASTIPIPQLWARPSEPKWVTHPAADVAVLPLRPDPELQKRLASRSLPSTIFISKVEAPSRERPLTVVGFPLGLGVLFTGPGGKISAITKESKAASGLLTLQRADTKTPSEFFVLDSPSVGGFSGAPVFILPAAFSKGAGLSFSQTTLFVGLVHGTVSDETGGTFALVVPSAFITQTLTQAYEAPTDP